MENRYVTKKAADGHYIFFLGYGDDYTIHDAGLGVPFGHGADYTGILVCVRSVGEGEGRP